VAEFLRPGAGAKKKRERERFNPANPRDVKRLVEALAFVDPDEEKTWRKSGGFSDAPSLNRTRVSRPTQHGLRVRGNMIGRKQRDITTSARRRSAPTF